MGAIEPLFVEPPAPWTTAWPALPALLMVLAGGWGLRRVPRPDLGLWLVLGVALLVRVIWLPVELHVFDGHEAEYLDLYLGRRDLSRGGPLLYPAMQWLYFLLGKLPAHEAVPVALNVAASLCGIAAVVGVVSRLAHPRAGLVAGAVLALWGNPAFWATSAYNVVLPHALGMVALWALAAWIDEARPLPCALLAGGAGALAVLTRVEAWLLAPVGLLLVLLHRPRGGLRMLPGLALGAGLGAWGSWLLLFPGTTPGAGQRSLSFEMNRDLFVYFAPWDVAWAAWIPVIGLAVGLRRWWRLYVPLAALIAGSHLVFASFDDYGFRHLLNASAGVAACVGALACSRFGRWALIPAAALLVLDTNDVAERYYAPEDALARLARAEDLPVRYLDDLDDCTLVCEDGRVVPEARQLSHFNLYDADEEATLRAAKGCLWWLRSIQDERWSSRAVRDRALRLEYLFVTTPSYRVVDHDDQVMGVLVNLGPRRHP